MNEWFGRGSNSDEMGPDPMLAEALGSLDPAVDDPNYWLRFRGWVLSGAARELARRRLVSELTVGDVLSSWARTVLPTAALAAALAGIMLLRSGDPGTVQPVGVEELLVTDLPSETVPLLLSPEIGAGAVSFAADDY